MLILIAASKFPWSQDSWWICSINTSPLSAPGSGWGSVMFPKLSLCRVSRSYHKMLCKDYVPELKQCHLPLAKMIKTSCCKILWRFKQAGDDRCDGCSFNDAGKLLVIIPLNGFELWYKTGNLAGNVTEIKTSYRFFTLLWAKLWTAVQCTGAWAGTSWRWHLMFDDHNHWAGSHHDNHPDLTLLHNNLK